MLPVPMRNSAHMQKAGCSCGRHPQSYHSRIPRCLSRQPLPLKQTGYPFFFLTHARGFRFRVMIISLEMQKAMHEQTIRQDAAINRLHLRLAKHFIHADDHFSQKCLPLFLLTRGRKEIRRRKSQHVRCFVLPPIPGIQRSHPLVSNECDAELIIFGPENFPYDLQALPQRFVIQREQLLLVFDEDFHSQPLSWEHLLVLGSESGDDECQPERA